MNYRSYNDLLICSDSERCVIFHLVPVSIADRLQSIKKVVLRPENSHAIYHSTSRACFIFTGTVSKHSCITGLFLSPLNVKFELSLTISFLHFPFYFHFALFHSFNVPIEGKMHVDFASNHMANICRKNLKLVLEF